ncbi:MAG: hypothetical protein DRI90_25995 [Deltaproteobacteria bacterium]|nr:MAG: hypothetical protein DRI90_25995 [Deltaproteobacteria bacterium]
MGRNTAEPARGDEHDALATQHHDPPDGEGSPRSVSRLTEGFQARSATLRCTLAAVGAWTITVAPLVAAGQLSALGRVLAFVAVVPGVVGPQLLERNHRKARHVGITTFLVLVLATWALASQHQALAGVDLFRALLGALAWGVFGIAWSHPWSVPSVKLKKAPPGRLGGLKPRRETPHHAVAVAAAGAITGIGCLVMAWRVEDASRAVFAQAIATGCAIALVTSASTVAVLAGKDKRRAGYRSRFPIDRRVLNLLALMLLVGSAAYFVYSSAR